MYTFHLLVGELVENISNNQDLKILIVGDFNLNNLDCSYESPNVIHPSANFIVNSYLIFFNLNHFIDLFVPKFRVFNHQNPAWCNPELRRLVNLKKIAHKISAKTIK